MATVKLPQNAHDGQTTVIPPKRQINIDIAGGGPNAPILVHRRDIAHVTRALLMASPGPDFDAGVIAMAAAMGVEVHYV